MTFCRFVTYGAATASNDRRLVPYYLLKGMSSFKHLDVARKLIIGNFGTFSPHLDVPSPSDVERIRSICPNLESLEIDIAL